MGDGEHVAFTVGEDGVRRCDDCTAMVHELVQRVGSHQAGDFCAGYDERGVQHAAVKAGV